MYNIEGQYSHLQGWRYIMNFRKTELFRFSALMVMITPGILSCSSSTVPVIPCSKQADCLRGYICFTGACTVPTNELIDYSSEIDQVAMGFLDELKSHQLNVVTAESLTAGMIISSIDDVPNYGSYLYGGFSTYDSDAKRQFLGVKVGDVYTKECSLEMAIGAITHSRALVGLSVTGKAGPVAKNDLQSLGVVDVAVSIRTDVAAAGSDIPDDPSFPQTFTSVSRRIYVCDSNGHKETVDLCDKYKIEAAADAQGFVSEGVLDLVRKLIRQDTVINALTLGTTHLDTYNCQMVGQKAVCPNLSQICTASYDGMYTAYGEPTWVIDSHRGPQSCP